MPDYKKMYSILFNQVTDTIEQLKKAQQKTEEMYTDCDDTPLLIATSKEESL